MSIRVHKAIGYGGIFSNISSVIENLDQNGVDGEIDKLIHDNLENNEKELFLETEHMASKLNTPYPGQFWECIKHTEYELDDPGYTIIIPPIWLDKWSRFDDVIDYYDGDFINTETVIKILDEPLYPYSDWMNPISFQIIYDEFIKQKIPYIPLSIRLICDRVGLDWRPMRPMVATWWG